MPIDLKIPVVGESITEVQINEWLKSVGDLVKADEPVAVVDSEKTTFDLPAPQAGKLTKIFHQAGETVRVGTVVAQFELAGEASATPTPSPYRGAVGPHHARATHPHGTPSSSPTLWKCTPPMEYRCLGP